MEGGLTAPNPDGVVLPLKRLEAHEAAKQLGILTAPDGNIKSQLQHLKAKASKFAENLWTQGLLSHNEAWINMTHTVRKTLEYPMPATTLTEKEREAVATIVHKVALPKAGFVHSFPLKILHGPTKYQRVGHMRFWHNQELVHVQEFLNEVQLETCLGLK